MHLKTELSQTCHFSLTSQYPSIFAILNSSTPIISSIPRLICSSRISDQCRIGALAQPRLTRHKGLCCGRTGSHPRTHPGKNLLSDLCPATVCTSVLHKQSFHSHQIFNSYIVLPSLFPTSGRSSQDIPAAGQRSECASPLYPQHEQPYFY